MHSLSNNQPSPNISFNFNVIRNINRFFKNYCVSKNMAGEEILFDLVIVSI